MNASWPRDAYGERGIWQRRFWEHTICDECDVNNHLDYIHYIHYNLVKHGHVASPADWPHSCIHRYIEQGLLIPGWGADLTFDDDTFGK